MAVIIHKTFNAETGRNDLHLVNQQFDFLVTITWDAEIQNYTLSCSSEEANELTGRQGDEALDLKGWQAFAAKELVGKRKKKK